MSKPKSERLTEGIPDRTGEPRAVRVGEGMPEPRAVRVSRPIPERMSEPAIERPSYGDTQAAQLLRSALRVLATEKGISLREVGRRLGYRQPVVLSHMASGRVPIPIDRAPDIARAVDLPERTFLLACLRQRHPDVNWGLLCGEQDDFAHELTVVAGKPLDDLRPEYKWVMREVVRDPQPSDRWLKTAEMQTVELIRELRPDFITEGLNSTDLRAIREALSRA